MQVLWLSGTQGDRDCRRDRDSAAFTLLQHLREKGYSVTLGYRPHQKIDPDFFRAVDAAFPWVAPELQLPQINPDAILIWRWSPDWESLTWPMTQIPIVFIRRAEGEGPLSFPIPSSVVMDEPVGEQSIREVLSFIESGARRKASRTRSEKKTYSVSVIMRSRNDAQVIGQTLKSLFSQTVVISHVLLVDSSSTDETLEVVKRYPVEVLTIAADDYFPGRVLNRAMSLTKGEWVIFLNSDAVLLSPLSLEHLLRRLEEPFVIAAYARQLPRPEAEVWVQRDYAAAYPDTNIAPGWMSFSLCLAAMKREAWNKHPFYSAAWGSEDVEWGHWAKSVGWDIAYASDALCMHSHNYSLRQLYGRRYIEGEADAFISHRKYSWGRLIRDVFASSAKDSLAYWRAGDYTGLVGIPLRRLIYHWGYFRGNCWGNSRKRTGNSDVKTGQQTVLKRYDEK